MRQASLRSARGAAVLLLLAWLPGCALFPTRDADSGEPAAPHGGAATAAAPLTPPPARPDRPSDYDVLVGELSQLEVDQQIALEDDVVEHEVDIEVLVVETDAPLAGDE